MRLVSHIIGLWIFLLACIHISLAQSVNLPEPLYVKVDKDFYISGEDLWYSVFFLDPPTRQSNIVHVELWDASGTMRVSQKLKVESGQARGDMALPANLPTGYYQLRAFTVWNLNFKPQVLFSRLLPIYQPEPSTEPLADVEMPPYEVQKTGPIVVSSIKAVYAPREAMALSLGKVQNSSGNAVVSIVVKDVNFLKPSGNILEAKRKSLDNRVSIDVNDQGLIPAENQLQYRFSLKHPETQNPVNSPYVVGFVNQTGQRLVKSVQAGTVAFDFIDFYDSTQVQIFDASPYEETYTPIVRTIPLSGQLSLPQITRDIPPISPRVNQYIQEYQRRFQLDRLFGSLTNIRARRNVVKATRPEPTSSYEVDAFNPYDGLEDFIKNAVPPLKIRTRRAKNAQGVFDPDNPTYDKTFKLYIPNDFTLTRNNRVKKPPLLQVNEYFTYDKNAVLALNWTNVARLDIYNRLLYLPDQFGPIGEFGVISFITRDGKTPDRIRKSPNTVSISGFYSPRIFNTPDYSEAGPLDSKIPDFRPVFYWNPLVEVNPGSPQNLELFTADKPGQYLLQIEGMAEDGSPILHEQLFEIRIDQ